MFFEECGKLFFLKTRLFFFYLLILAPLGLALFFLWHETQELQEVQGKFQTACRKERLAMDRKKRKEAFLNRYSNPNPYFINQQIESFSLLEKEKEKLQSLVTHPALPESSIIKERLSFIEENKLLFSEEKVETSPFMKEANEKLIHPVQMDEMDLQQILAILEDLPTEGNVPLPKRPQMIVKDFRLKKIKTPLETETFEVQMDLIKREFFQ